MPGALIVADYQAEIRDVLTGAGTDYEIDAPGISGLDVPDVKTSDTDLLHAAGAYLGRDYTGVRIITIPYFISKLTAAPAGAVLVVLKGLWAPSTVDLPLHMQVPGFGHIAVTGRPRGLVVDLADISVGFVRALATFVCGDPTITVVP